ncbi:MAG: DNA-binding response regulator [Flavobacteriales bacterium]|nr:DNA-binding response regulator [Flavobacteriales bacterium]MBG15968.1 DNA-binding response regulator [Crocinitomicaceae bacterium]|tara:strand:+ start:7878 stop:8570 length:693 start_codon:yes stop_codon:yes gene_type:complete
MMKCLIVDDDELSRGILEDLINDTASLDLVASCGNPLEAFNILKESKIDLLFLDIEMPKMDGISMLKALSPLPQVILVTSHDQYAVESYEYDVTDFVKKPISAARFLKAVEKANKRFSSDSSLFTTKGETIFIKSDSKLVQINTHKIFWIEALGNYMRVITEDGKYTILSTMKDVASKLPSDEFVRVHRSFIVRLDKIESIEDNYIIINNNQINIGKAYKDGLSGKLNLL